MEVITKYYYLKKIFLHPFMIKFITALLGIVILIIVIHYSHQLLARYVHDKDTRYKARKFMTFTGYIIALFIILIVFSDKLGNIHIALGMAGAGIAFASQEVIISIAGWFGILFFNFYKTGDRIQLGGTKGDVIDIVILRTTLMEVGEWVNGDLYNGRVVRIANSFVFKEPVFNYSGDFPFLWDEMSIPIKHGSDIQYVYQLLQRIVQELIGEYSAYAKKSWDQLVMVKKFLIEDAQVEPMVTMTADQNWMTFTIRYVIDYRSRRSTKNKLFIRILKEIEESQGKVMLASSSLEINVSDNSQITPR